MFKSVLLPSIAIALLAGALVFVVIFLVKNAIELIKSLDFDSEEEYEL